MFGRKGFTLIELMVVVVVLGILIAIGLPNYVLLTNRARAASVKSNGHTAQLAVEDFASKNAGNVPQGGTALADIVANLPGGAVYENPWNHAAGLSVGAGADEGMVDYSDPTVTGAAHTYRLDCYGEGANLVLSLSNG